MQGQKCMLIVFGKAAHRIHSGLHTAVATLLAAMTYPNDQSERLAYYPVVNDGSVQVFFRRVRSGLRTAVAALLASVLLLTDEIARNLTIAFFASITAIIVCDSSLGRTLRNCSMVFFAVAVSSLSSIICVELFGRSEPAMILCMTATCALIAYPDIHVIRRKFGLAYTGICFIGFYVYKDISITFPLRFGATALLGTQCAVVAMLLPVPLWATNLVKDRAERAAAAAAALFATQLGAFCGESDARGRAEARTLAGMLRRAVAENLASMKEREEELWWEFAGGKPTAKLKRLIKVFDALLMHSASLDLALQTGHIAESPPLLFQLLRDPLAEMASWTGAVIQAAVNDLRGRKGSVEETERLAVYGTDLLKRFNAALQTAREQAYYGLTALADLGHEETRKATEADGGGSAGGTRERRRSRVETLLRCSVESLIASQFFLFHTRHIAQEAFSLLSGDPPVTRPGLPSRRRSLLQSVMPNPPPKPCQNPECASAAARRSHSENDADSVPLRGRKRRVTDSSGSHETRAAAKPGNATERMGRWADALAAATRVRLDGNKRSIRVAIAISCTGVIGIATDRVFPFLATATVGVLFGGYQGATFRTALNRFLVKRVDYDVSIFPGSSGSIRGKAFSLTCVQGTVAGSMYGYISILLVHERPVAIGALLVLWVAFATFARYSKTYGYCSVVAAFTAAIIMLGYRAAHEGIKEYALGRITQGLVFHQTWIGILAYLVVETCLWPSRAAALLRGALVASLQDARACFAAVVQSYMEDECVQCRQRAIARVASTEQRCGALIAKQGPLIDEAAAEPDLWRAPFVGQGYIRLVELQKRVMLLLYAMDCSLQATTKDASGEHYEKLARPLQGPLRTLEAEVLLTLDGLIVALQIHTNEKKPAKKSSPSPEAKSMELVPASKHVGEISSDRKGAADARSRVAEDQNGVRQSAGLCSGNLETREKQEQNKNAQQDPKCLPPVKPTGQNSRGASALTELAARNWTDRGTASVPTDLLSGAPEHGTAESQSPKSEGHRKHHTSGRRNGTKKEEPAPLDEQIFQHSLPSMGGDVSPRGSGSIQKVLKEFEHRYEDVISGLISAKLAHPDVAIVDNGAMLSFNALVFGMRALIAEAAALEDAVRELLQVESPIDLARCLPPPCHPLRINSPPKA
ncbi:Hypothetical protein KFL_002590190 [Klebsormidium nitens]|uniref:Uncharacterized protein n=1 Tax=Klebsormidium nitens TaxID=105231 RepID=A0A1Y1I9T9_KLENI|nr:Hypothetical protein KFL_002590190 [Klebsormidium nitens]|eukprot:GAQ85891.1 Hypothetical protein KFL_002590190 [Klebsormidium nitens]